MARQWEHTHVNSSGWTSAPDVNAQPCTPCSVSRVLPGVSCPSLAVFPGLWGSTAPFQSHWPQPPYPSLLCAVAWILNRAPFCQERRPRRFKKLPKPQGRKSALELPSPLLDSCLTVRFGVSCRALHLAQIPCTDDPKFPAPAPVPAWCSPRPWFNSLQNLVQWDNSHSFVEVRT